MPAATMAWAAPAALGALGLYQANQQNNAKRKAAEKAGNVSNAVGMEQLQALMKLREIADKYDPKDSTRVAVESASGVAAQSLEKALRRMKVGYGGSNPEGDSGFAVSAQRSVNDKLDPLKMFAAQETANESFKKADMYRMVLNAPTGQIADNYFKSAATMPGADPSGSLSLISQALQRLFAQKGGAGGRGDDDGSGIPPNQAGGWGGLGGIA